MAKKFGCSKVTRGPRKGHFVIDIDLRKNDNGPTLDDLLDFLKGKGLTANDVVLPRGFLIYARKV